MDAGLVILDGWGLNPNDGDDVLDAVAAADTPTFDRLRDSGAFGTLETHGGRVGLPEGQMGNSEVGHLTIGAGRVVYQESARITDAIARWRGEETSTDDAPADPPLDENPALQGAIDYAREHDGTLHLLGLVSDGGVHSYQAHLHALIDLAAEQEVPAVTHAFTDGRDTAPRGGEGYLADLEQHAAERGTGEVATVVGRYFAMDRDENWERTRKAYDAIVNRTADHEAPSAVAAVQQSYDRDTTDEFVEPTIVEGSPALSDGDAAIFVNFRSDRARQLTRMLAGIDPVWEFETSPPAIELVTMTEYDETFDLPVAFRPRQSQHTLGEVLADRGLTQLRIAETEKYAHVTYFLNGGREVEFPGEIREIVPSPDVATYDQQPEMSAPEVTDTAIDVIQDDDPDVVVLNYANPDMVGHTGDFEAAVEAVEAVDAQLDRLVTAMQQAGGHVLVTADHGNADDMGTADRPHTAHTTNPVPFVYLAAEAEAGAGDSDGRTGAGSSDGRVGDGVDASGGRQVRDGGGLADVAPTILGLLGVEQPQEMAGRSLLDP